MNQTIGYARVSSIGQSLEVQLDKLKNCDKVYQEKRSGRQTDNRPELLKALDYVREGYSLVKNGDPPALLGRHAKFDNFWNLIVTPKCEPPSNTQRRNHETSRQFKSHTLGV